MDVDTPLLEAVMPSNRRQIDRGFHLVRDASRKRIGNLGFSFKAGTDDLRESPMVDLIERLLGKGYEFRVYERNVSLANLHGANRAYIEHEIPHITSLLCDTIEQVVAANEVVVIGNSAPEVAEVAELADDDRIVIDLARIAQEPPPTAGMRASAGRRLS